MRPVANFTLHAILAAAIAALATTSAAAGEARLTLGGIAAGGGGHIEVESYSWGTANSGTDLGGWSKVDGLSAKVDSVEQDTAASGDMAIKGSKISQNAPAAPPVAGLKRGQRISAIPRAEVAGARHAGSGQASGKRELEPPARGTLTVEASLPNCTAGTAYPDAELQTAVARHLLRDVVITRCGTNRMSLDYAEVVRR